MNRPYIEDFTSHQPRVIYNLVRGSQCLFWNAGGMPIQYIHYASYGELIANQQTIGYDERFKCGGDVNRGMPPSILGGKIETARDVGNFAAGYLAARKGLSYGATMWAFDLYQNYQNKTTSGEPPVSRWAQTLGFGFGLDARLASNFNRLNIAVPLKSKIVL